MTREAYRTVLYQYARVEATEQARRAADFHALMRARRTVRDISDEPVAREVVERVVATAATAPSGANQQPWRFVVVSSPEVKRAIRTAAEAEERENYGRRFPEAWKAHLAPLGTDCHKAFLERAPYLVVVFRIDYTEREGAHVGARAEREKHYYVMESVGIACGLLIAAIHNAGLVTVPHTPNPMGFLSRILGRPTNERPYLLLPLGYPAAGAHVPDISRKPFDEVVIFVE